MRWSIRNQILIPLLGIQAIAVTAATVTMATLAVRRSEREIVSRLNDVVETLTHGNFPYTESVLNRMRGLSGAHFVVSDAGGRVLHTSLPRLEELPTSMRGLAHAGRIESLQGSPPFLVDGTPHFAMSVQSQNGPPGDSLFILYPRTSLQQARWEAVMPSLLLGTASLGVMMVVTSWIANHISGRIRRVQRQVARIADGDFHEVDPGGREDEVAELTLSINRMSGQLKRMQQTIHHSERARLLTQLAAGLAHQLRNSLTGARMSVQLHAKPPSGRGRRPDPDRGPSAARDDRGPGQGLLSLGRVERRPAEVLRRCGRLLADVAFLVDPACQHAKVNSHSARGGRSGIDRGPRPTGPGMRAAILNLALNAIEAAGPGGSVAARSDIVSEESGRRGSRLADPDRRPSWPIRCASAFVTSKPEGVGLGLALAHQVATDHGGRLSWTRAGGETRFRLALAQA